MRKAIEKGSAEWKAFTAVWELYQAFAIPEDNDEYWEELVKAMNKIEVEHNSILANYLALGVAKALNEIAKGEK